MSPVRHIWDLFKLRHNGNTLTMRCVAVVDAWGTRGTRERCLVLRYCGMRRNTSSCTSKELGALLDQLGATCTPHLRRVPEGNPLCIAQAPILCLHFRLALPVQSTPAPYRSPPSICGVAVSADVTHDEYERHRACLSVKTSTNQPFHVPLHARTLRGAALSS